MAKGSKTKPKEVELCIKVDGPDKKLVARLPDGTICDVRQSYPYDDLVVRDYKTDTARVLWRAECPILDGPKKPAGKGCVMGAKAGITAKGEADEEYDKMHEPIEMTTKMAADVKVIEDKTIPGVVD